MERRFSLERKKSASIGHLVGGTEERKGAREAAIKLTNLKRGLMFDGFAGSYSILKEVQLHPLEVGFGESLKRCTSVRGIATGRHQDGKRAAGGTFA